MTMETREQYEQKLRRLAESKTDPKAIDLEYRRVFQEDAPLNLSEEGAIRALVNAKFPPK
jgi:hypothetical protein